MRYVHILERNGSKTAYLKFSDCYGDMGSGCTYYAIPIMTPNRKKPEKRERKPNEKG